MWLEYGTIIDKHQFPDNVRRLCLKNKKDCRCRLLRYAPAIQLRVRQNIGMMWFQFQLGLTFFQQVDKHL